MRIVFMGTPDFAVPCLQALLDAGHEITAVVTQPDKPVGRKQILTPSPVKVLAQQYRLPVIQPQRLKNTDVPQQIKDFHPDVIIVVAYGKILPPEVLQAAPYGCINVHASLLPYYRGAAPIQWAVINGESKTGVSIMQMDEGLDTGDILLVKETPIGVNETSAELFERLSVIGAEALVVALEQLKKGMLTRTPQPHGDFGYAGMITKDLCPIDWSKSAAQIHNLVRGLQTWPVAQTSLCGSTLKIHQTVLTDTVCENGVAGEVIDSRKQFLVRCGDGRCIKILSVQAEGKKRMDSQAFLLGHPISEGTRMGE